MIISREQWGARYGDGKPGATYPADEVWLHHSATVAPDVSPPYDDDYTCVRKLEAVGANRFGQTYGLSYTFVVSPAGLIFAGHDVRKLGAHTAGHNTIGRAICLLGDYSARDLTPAQCDAVVWLLRHGKAQGWWTQARLSGGHRDTKATVCPGDRAYAAIPELNRRAANNTPATTTAPAPVRVEPPVLKYGMRGSAAVRNLQNFLIRAFPSYAGGLTPTGNYLEQTRGVVKEFQVRAGVTGPDADGTIVGSRTNAALARYGYRV